jgi:xanthine dehydrogenase YagR molybdenum-binding subunit
MGSTHQASGPHRIEGHDKVTGAAKYAGDLQASDIGEPLDVAAVVTSSQGSGRVLPIDAEAARDGRGVRAIITHQNAPRLCKVLSTNGGEIGDFLPLQDDRLRYNGQCIAIVVAETLGAAQEAAALVTAKYSPPAQTWRLLWIRLHPGPRT